MPSSSSSKLKPSHAHFTTMTKLTLLLPPLVVLALSFSVHSSASNRPPPNALPVRLDLPDASFCSAINALPRPWNKYCHRSADFSCDNHSHDLYNQTLMFSFSSQDFYLYTTHFRHLPRPGVYWDVATNDAIAVSNTFFFDRCLHWKGVCVEANPMYYERIHRERSCHLVPTCVSDRSRMVKFLIEGQAGGVQDAAHKHNKLYQTGKRPVPPAVNMKCTTMADVQARLYGPAAPAAPRPAVVVVDYLSLDVEGHEMAVLRGIDWARVAINVITVEVSKETEPQIDAFLADKGFERHTPLLDDRSRKLARLGDDLIYKRNHVVWGKPV